MNEKGGMAGNILAIMVLIIVIYVVVAFKLYDPVTIQQLTQQQSSGFLESQTESGGSARLTVIVVDKATGKALTDAGIYLQYIVNENPKVQTGVSTGDGSFNFLNLVPGGEFTLRVDKVGYKEFTTTSTLPESQQSTLTVELEKANGVLENIQQ
ncbi:MAG: carboxypeptidase regulatory-like domain-containing protein [Candidatus Diapherotrites archaeon]|nr:carboxypeptidase regulatory-like domain-containing protein [Candidatus Diapherotrites archaeon]